MQATTSFHVPVLPPRVVFSDVNKVQGLGQGQAFRLHTVGFGWLVDDVWACAITVLSIDVDI